MQTDFNAQMIKNQLQTQHEQLSVNVLKNSFKAHNLHKMFTKHVQ